MLLYSDGVIEAHGAEREMFGNAAPVDARCLDPARAT